MNGWPTLGRFLKFRECDMRENDNGKTDLRPLQEVGEGGDAALQAEQATPLKRSLGLPLLTLYGLGVTIGAGIYVLVGKVSGEAGVYAPVSFLIASVLAGFTGCSYAELGSRFWRSAGEVLYVEAGFGQRWLAMTVGLLVAATGLLSSAVVIIGFVGYLNELIPVPAWFVISVVVIFLSGVTVWGITESVTISAIITVVELAGLLMVVVPGFPLITQALVDPTPLIELSAAPFSFAGIFAGALLAFFAYIGFEDMANVIEEVKEPARVFPKAVLITIAGASTLYLLLSVIALLAVPVDELSASEAPLARVYEAVTGQDSSVLSIIAIFAVLNGALIQMIMASRLVYGVARKGWLPTAFGFVWQTTRTPVVAIATVGILILSLALFFPIVEMATVTSLVTLAVFSLVNASLVALRLKEARGVPTAGGYKGGLKFPMWVPSVGCFVSVGMIVISVATY